MDEADRGAGDDLPVVHEAAVLELQHRHRALAEEMARLSAILAASGRAPGELDATTDPRVGLSPWEQPRRSGEVLRGGNVQPEPQRVVHLGTERTRRAEGRRTLAVGASAGAVGAVVAVAVLMLGDLPGLGGGAQAEATAPSPTAEATVLEAVVAQPAAPPQAVPEPPRAAIDAVLVRASTTPTMSAGTAGLVARLPVLADLSGPARGEEAADLYGLAVTEARTDTTGVAGQIVAALEPEVSLDGVVALATNRPDVVGPGMAALVADLAALPAVALQDQQVEAQRILDGVASGVTGGTITGPFCNSIAAVLAPYGAAPPG